MIKCIVSDFSWVLLFPTDPEYTGRLNSLHAQLLTAGDYDFWSYFQLNKPLLDFYQSLTTSVDLYVFTSEYIQEYPPVKEVIAPIFRKVFIAAEMGMKKSEVRAYDRLTVSLGVLPEEILFIDDVPEHVAAAQEAGWNVVLFEDTETVIVEMKKQLS